MSKKTSQNSYKKNKSRSKDRFLESIISQSSQSDEVISSSKISTSEGSASPSIISSVTIASKFGLNRELKYIGIISSILVVVLIATSFAI